MPELKNMLQKEYVKTINGKTYYSVAAFLSVSLGRTRSVTGLTCRIPQEHIYCPKKRGRGSGYYATKQGLIELIKTMPRFPLNIKEKLGVYTQTTGEQTLEYILNSFAQQLEFLLKGKFYVVMVNMGIR